MDALTPKWEENEHRLIASPGLTIGGVPMHLEAIPVEYVHGAQEATDPEDDAFLGALWAWNGNAGPFVTLDVDGVEYVLIATPHCD